MSRPSQYVELMQDVAEAVRRVWGEQASNFDVLTGIPNRSSFARRLDVLLNRSDIDAVLLVEIDVVRFRDINARYGFGRADLLLQRIAARLEALDADVVARIGTDEFAMAHRVDSVGHGERWLERISVVLRRPFVLDESIVRLNFSTAFVLVDKAAGSGHIKAGSFNL